MEDEPVGRVHHLSRALPYASMVPDEPDSFRSLLRTLQPVLGDRIWNTARDGAALESTLPAESPVVADATPLESPAFTDLPPERTSDIAGFLDGIQRTRLIAHIDGVPVVYAAVAAVIRERVARRMHTWNAPLVQRAIYLSRSAAGESLWGQLEASGVPLVDTAGDAMGVAHPFELRARAVAKISAAREQLEKRLARSWIDHENRWLLVDGGLSGIRELAAPPHTGHPVFGVVKSHATLYGTPAMVQATMRLEPGQRTGLFLIRHRVRQAVISWYLRARSSSSGDPLHGLVRLEVVAPPSWTMADATDAWTAPAAEVAQLAELAGRLSGWVLAERSPVALPDARWDRLVYGVYDCERYLSALVGPN